LNETTAILSEAPRGMRMSIGTLARSGAVAGIIKLTSAGLAFLMFVAIARVTDARQFGLFSATYAGASLVSFFASMGQQSTVLRFWPQYESLDDLPAAHGFMARAILVAVAGLMASSLLVLATGFLPLGGSETPEWLPLCAAAAVLSFALGWTEFTSGAFRAKNALVYGLLPRDVIWRAATMAVVVTGSFMHVHLSAVNLVLLTAGLLLAVAIPQTVVLLRDTMAAERGRLSNEQRREFNSVTVGLWGVTSLPPALGQVSTLLVAAILGPEAAGAIFVADRTTRLVVLALHGINQALAPQISGAFYVGDRQHVQRISSLAALGGFVIALGVLAAFWAFGPFILSIFDRAYATPTMHATLVIFGLGATLATACGPIELLLQLTGLQHSLLKLLIVVNVLGLAATALATDLFGPIGAAVTIAGTVVTWNVIAVMIARRRIGINPSLAGLRAGGEPFMAGLFRRGGR
jgi:O-antigen/teichoic acid export membrane protein